MPTKRDYYEVLGVDRSAGPDDIKRAYRKGALKYHPDNYKGDKAEGEAKFKELAEAYEVLSAPDRRQLYDRHGHEGLRGAGVHDFSNMGFGDIFSMFEDIFGGSGGMGGRASHADRGYDLETQVELTLEQVATGLDETLEFERMDFCDTCGGSGAKPGTTADKCSGCGGYGKVQQQVSGFFGMSIRVTVCPQCKGKGVIVKEPCLDCGGSGRRRKKRVLTVRIPPGIRDGQVIRIRNEGEPGTVGGRGDLHCYVQVKPHPLLIRRQDDLYCQVPILFTQAALGGMVEVPTLAGPEQVEVPAGSQTGDVIRLKRRGLPNARSGRTGDQHVQVFVEVPRKLNKKQRELLKEYAKTEGNHVSQERKTFVDKLKEYFTSK